MKLEAEQTLDRVSKAGRFLRPFTFIHVCGSTHILTDHHDDGESSRSRFRVQLASCHHVTNKPEKLADVPPAVCVPVAFG